MGCCIFKGSNLKPIWLLHPLTSIWLGIQHIRISLFDIESSLQSNLMISEFSSFFYYLMIDRERV